MPRYEYRCENGHQYEKREGFDAPSKQKCPTCKAVATRLLFAPPVVFKGSGFYKTDNRGSSSGGDSAPPPAEKAAEPAADASSDATTESAAAS